MSRGGAEMGVNGQGGTKDGAGAAARPILPSLSHLTPCAVPATSSPEQLESTKSGQGGRAGSKLSMEDTLRNWASCHLASNTPFPKTPRGPENPELGTAAAKPTLV